MAAPRVRLDGYGQPLPPLADARHEVLADRPLNQEQRRVLLRMLQDQFDALLRRGTYATISLSFDVVDGIIQKKVSLHVQHDYYTTLEP